MQKLSTIIHRSTDDDRDGRPQLELNVIPKGYDDYLTFNIVVHEDDGYTWRLRFIDSYQFMVDSLDRLVNNLVGKGKDKFHHTAHFMNGHSLDLLLRKGVYPYEYMDGWGRFDEKERPAIDNFHSVLSGQTVKKEDYEHAQKVWEAFNIKELGEYHDLYLLTDVLLLAVYGIIDWTLPTMCPSRPSPGMPA